MLPRPLSPLTSPFAVPQTLPKRQRRRRRRRQRRLPKVPVNAADAAIAEEERREAAERAGLPDSVTFADKKISTEQEILVIRAIVLRESLLEVPTHRDTLCALLPPGSHPKLGDGTQRIRGDIVPTEQRKRRNIADILVPTLNHLRKATLECVDQISQWQRRFVSSGSRGVVMGVSPLLTAVLVPGQASRLHMEGHQLHPGDALLPRPPGPHFAPCGAPGLPHHAQPTAYTLTATRHDHSRRPHLSTAAAPCWRP